jgi:hypothetical protein
MYKMELKVIVFASVEGNARKHRFWYWGEVLSWPLEV